MGLQDEVHPLDSFKPALLGRHPVLRTRLQRLDHGPLVSGEEITSLRKNGFHRYVHDSKKHSPGRVNWSWVRRGWNGVGSTDLYDVVAKEHHLEKEGDD